jgi:uroporphyrinogen III methyltransferase/synthase
VVIGEVVGQREKLDWFEVKALFGWRVLIPRTQDHAGSIVGLLRTHGAVPIEVPTISVEPPRTPQQIDRAVHGLVSGRYEWIGFTSVNAVRAIREKLQEYGLDARSFAGLKVAAVGQPTVDALIEFGVRPDITPVDEQTTSALLEEWPAYDSLTDPINRVFLPRADIATDTLVAGLAELGWEVEDVTAYRTVRAAPPPARPARPQDRWLRRRPVHVEQHGAQPRRHRRQAAPHHGRGVHRPADGEGRRGARPARRRPRGDEHGGRSRRGACCARRGAALGIDRVGRRHLAAEPPSCDRTPQGDLIMADAGHRTVVHLLRHGEVYNPEGVLYGRLPGYYLSDLGKEMAVRAADALAGSDVTLVVSSPMERGKSSGDSKIGVSSGRKP